MTESAHALPDDDRRPDPLVPAEDRPDWLVSSDQGAEDERRKLGDSDADEGLRFTTSQDLSTAVPMERPKIPTRPEPGAKPAAERSTGPRPWAAAASSVPRLKLETPTASGTAAGAAARGPAAGAPLRAMPPRAAGWDEDSEDGGDAAFPDDTGPIGPVTAAPPRKLDEPLWVIALEALRSNLKVQIVTAAVVLVPLLAWILWPRSEPGVSVHALRQEPSRWDGQVVRINGRVGEVFHVGAGWAFNLHQGRDTIVVFTRGAAPRTRDRISIAGAVSTGYLDGQPRQAIFAEPEAR